MTRRGRAPLRWRPPAWIPGACACASTSPPGTGNVSVRLDYRSAVRFPLLGVLLDDLRLRGEAVMRLER